MHKCYQIYGEEPSKPFSLATLLSNVIVNTLKEQMINIRAINMADAAVVSMGVDNLNALLEFSGKGGNTKDLYMGTISPSLIYHLTRNMSLSSQSIASRMYWENQPSDMYLNFLVNSYRNFISQISITTDFQGLNVPFDTLWQNPNFRNVTDSFIEIFNYVSDKLTSENFEVMPKEDGNYKIILMSLYTGFVFSISWGKYEELNKLRTSMLLLTNTQMSEVTDIPYITDRLDIPMPPPPIINNTPEVTIYNQDEVQQSPQVTQDNIKPLPTVRTKPDIPNEPQQLIQQCPVIRCPIAQCPTCPLGMPAVIKLILWLCYIITQVTVYKKYINTDFKRALFVGGNVGVAMLVK